MSNQTPSFKEQAALFIGQTANLVSEGKDKVMDFVKEQKDNFVDFANDKKERAIDYLNDAQTLYLTKKALDEEKHKLEQLFTELGKVVYYLEPTAERKNAVDIASDIRLALLNIDELQKKYDALKEAHTSTDNNNDGGVSDDKNTAASNSDGSPSQTEEDSSSTDDENVADDEAFVRRFYTKD